KSPRLRRWRCGSAPGLWPHRQAPQAPVGAGLRGPAAVVARGDRTSDGGSPGVRRDTILRVNQQPVSRQRLRDLALLRRVRDRIDRDYAQPLNVEALAREVHMSAGHLSRQFRLAYGESPYSYLMTR